MPQKKRSHSPNKNLPPPNWSLKSAVASFKKRRLLRKKTRAKIQPHHAFRLTSSRDAARPLAIGGYFNFTHEVSRILWKRRLLFSCLALFYAIVVIVVGGLTTQDNYIQIQDFVTNATEKAPAASQGFGMLADSGVVLLSSLGTDGKLNDIQQIYLVLATLLTWLTTVWLLREIMAGRRPKLRDGLYNAGAPLVSAAVVALIFVIQLIPFALVAIIYAALTGVGLADKGLGAMMVMSLLALVGALTLYWLTSTLVALVVVTLPGMYPLRAMRAANDMVVSRRLRVMYRLLWMLLVAALAWVVIMLPVITVEAWLRNKNAWLNAIPTVPFFITIMGALTTIWITAYIYLMYRKLVDDNSQPG